MRLVQGQDTIPKYFDKWKIIDCSPCNHQTGSAKVTTSHKPSGYTYIPDREEELTRHLSSNDLTYSKIVSSMFQEEGSLL